MRFDHPDSKDDWFELSDQWTVRDVLAYDSQLEIGAVLLDNMYIRLWRAAHSILIINEDNYHVDDCPMDIDIDSIQSEKTMDLMKWVGMACYSARQALEPDEKN